MVSVALVDCSAASLSLCLLVILLRNDRTAMQFYEGVQVGK